MHVDRTRWWWKFVTEELLHGEQEAQRQTGNRDWVTFNGPSFYATSPGQTPRLLKFPASPKQRSRLGTMCSN